MGGILDSGKYVSVTTRLSSARISRVVKLSFRGAVNTTWIMSQLSSLWSAYLVMAENAQAWTREFDWKEDCREDKTGFEEVK